MSDVGPGYVLVVDDVAFMRRLLYGIIKSLGYEVMEAESGVRAVEMIRHRIPSLVFLDLMMPQVSGIHVCQWLRANEATKDVPVIICSAHQDRKNVEASIKAGATDFLCKPVTRANVKERIEKHLRRAPEAQAAR